MRGWGGSKFAEHCRGSRCENTKGVESERSRVDNGGRRFVLHARMK